MLAPSIGICCDAVARTSAAGRPGDLEHGRGDVDHVAELASAPRPAVDAASASGRSCRCGCRPSASATCLVHWYGVSIACAQPTA